MEIYVTPRDEKTASVCMVAVFLVSLHSGFAVHQETTQTSNSACYGTSGPVTMTLNCTTGYVIAIDQIWVGAKDTKTGCPTIFDAGSTDESCCSPTEIGTEIPDCIFVFDHSNYDFYHSTCNGIRECTVQVQNVLSAFGACDQAIYPITTIFAYIDYVCIDASSITTTCSTFSTTIASTSTYIASEDFPNGMATSTSACTCSVKTDDPSATLQVVTLQRQLTGNSDGSCDQSLSLLDSGQKSLVDWVCSDNTYVEETYATGSDYVIMNLNNDRTAADGNLWVEIRASSPASSLTVNCSVQLTTTSSTSTASTSSTTDTTTTTTATTTSTVTASSTTTASQAATTTATAAITATCMNTSSTVEESTSNVYLIVVICLSVLLGCSLLGNAVLAYKHFGKRSEKQTVTPVTVVNQRFNRQPGAGTSRK